MKFKNKQTKEIVEVNGYAQEFAYSHNSKWEKTEGKDVKELTVAEIKAKLDKLEIKYDKKAKKDDLIALLP